MRMWMCIQARALLRRESPASLAALEAADAALNALDSGGGSGSKSSADGDDDELDERLERAIDERVRAQTQMLEQKLDDLRELAESINDEDCD